MNPHRRSEIELFYTAVVSRLGFSVAEHNLDQVDQVLGLRLKESRCESVAAYLRRLGNPDFARAELREVAAELSVGETYFFRHPEHFLAVADVAIAQRIAARKETRQLRLLSAGCASGEEAYSLASLLHSWRPALEGWDIRITGIDANPRVLDKAREGRYSAWSLRGLSDARRAGLFKFDGQSYSLNQNIRSMVVFEERNLLDDDANFWRPEYFDIIFCRNVAIYFTPHAIRQIVDRLTASLVGGGYLFLSPSETLRGITHEFHLRHTHGAFYYQKRLPHETVAAHATFDPAPPAPGAAHQRTAVAGVDAGDSWVAAISQAAGRIAALADRSKRPPDGRPAVGDAMPPAAPAQSSLAGARDLLRQERYQDALAVLGSVPAPAPDDADTLLLRAVLLVNTAQVAAAEEICRLLLADDDLNAPAHYLMAVCQEHRGDCLRAAEHDNAAIYLDGAFAFPHLHLGLVARRLGDSGTARRELTAAMDLLGLEHTSRILLFGGGFGREALVRLCQSHLQACGGDL